MEQVGLAAKPSEEATRVSKGVCAGAGAGVRVGNLCSGAIQNEGDGVKSEGPRRPYGSVVVKQCWALLHCPQQPCGRPWKTGQSWQPSAAAYPPRRPLG